MQDNLNANGWIKEIESEPRKKRPYRTYTARIRAKSIRELLDLKKKGSTFEQISNSLGIPESTLRMWCFRRAKQEKKNDVKEDLRKGISTISRLKEELRTKSIQLEYLKTLIASLE